MDWLQEISHMKTTQTKLSHFLDLYGIHGLEQALQLYSDMEEMYVCNTRSATAVIRIRDIYYLKIEAHKIIIHTTHGTYQKYGTLTRELQTLSRCGFVKCCQSCAVSLSKISSIYNDTIRLINNETIHMSKQYAPKVIMAFHNLEYGKGW